VLGIWKMFSFVCIRESRSWGEEIFQWRVMARVMTQECHCQTAELILCFLAIMEDAFKMLPWPKNSPEDRGGEVVWLETRP